MRNKNLKNDLTMKKFYNIMREANFSRATSILMTIPTGLENLVKKIYRSLGPEIETDKKNQTYKIVGEGFFFSHLTEAYFSFKGYQKVT